MRNLVPYVALSSGVLQCYITYLGPRISLGRHILEKKQRVVAPGS